MDHNFLKWLTDPVECDLIEPDDVCEYCVFRDTSDCHLGLHGIYSELWK